MRKKLNSKKPINSVPHNRLTNETTIMCTHCFKMLGVPIRHGAEQCPILQAAYCTTCSMNGHFTTQCPNRPIQPLFTAQAIPNESQQQDNQPTICIGHTQEAYEQYCKTHGIPKAEKVSDTFARVKQHCASKGFKLTEAPELDSIVTKKKPVPK